MTLPSQSLLATLSTLSLSDALKIKDITAIGDVINGVHPGRRSDHDITLFGGTGVDLQNLAVASAAAKLAAEQRRFTFVGLQCGADSAERSIECDALGSKDVEKQ
ncbi:MAG: hypothetical protein MH219_05895 [Marinobacter sp.]|jgi:hypothetical protein|nr:hypothetical protein [Marinobacter sp.]